MKCEYPPGTICKCEAFINKNKVINTTSKYKDVIGITLGHPLNQNLNRFSLIAFLRPKSKKRLLVLKKVKNDAIKMLYVVPKKAKTRCVPKDHQ
jgi:hypothetical protein